MIFYDAYHSGIFLLFGIYFSNNFFKRFLNFLPVTDVKRAEMMYPAECSQAGISRKPPAFIIDNRLPDCQNSLFMGFTSFRIASLETVAS